MLDSDNRSRVYIASNCYTRLLIVASVRGGRVVRWCWVNFQGRGVLLVWIVVGQGPAALAVDADEVIWTFLLRLSILFFLSLWETARYRLKYCLKGPLDPKQSTKCCFFSYFSYDTKIRNAGVCKAKIA